MVIKDNFSINHLFFSKDIIIAVDGESFTLKLKTLKDYYTDSDWGNVFHIWTTNDKEIQGLYVGKLNSKFDRVSLILFELGRFDQYREVYRWFKKYLEEILPDIEIDMTKKELRIRNIIINPDIWEYILYILQLSCGIRVVKPPTFNSEEERKWYLAQKANEDRIAKIRAKNQSKQDEDQLLKILLSIIYSFPSFTMDYLINQTMAQIQWLQKQAAGAVSYEVNAQAFAAGNMKKGKKLEFFIK